MGGNVPPDLASVVDAWDGLTEPIKAGIVAMIGAANGRAMSGGAAT